MMPSRMMVALLMLLAVIPATIALTQLNGPADTAVLNTSTVSFLYTTDMQSLSGCTIFAGGFTFPDPSPTTGANDLHVQNVPDGTHSWNVTCTSGNISESSGTRTFSVDTAPPTLTVSSPVEGSSSVALDVTLSSSESGSCALTWNNQSLETIPVIAGVSVSRSYPVSGTGTFTARCTDLAGNAASVSRTATIEPLVYLRLKTDKASYSLGEPVKLTVEAPEGADVTVDVCPNQQGFVQCSGALIPSTTYPQVITLPYMNKTGEYLVDGIVKLGQTTRTNTTTYALDNTLGVSVSQNDTSRPNASINLTATATGGFPPYRYDWVLHDGRTFQNTQRVTLQLPEDGELDEVVNVTDAAGNKISFTHTILVRGDYSVKVIVLDENTALPIYGADVEMDGRQGSTLLDGSVSLSVSRGTHTLFVSAIGYEYAARDEFVNSTRTIEVRMRPKAGTPVVLLTAPADGSQTVSPTSVTFTLSTPTTASCSLVLDGWENGSIQAGNGTHAFTRDLPEGQHTARVRCDTGGAVALSSQVTFTVAPAQVETVAAQPTGGDESLQASLQYVSDLIDGLGSYGTEERQAIEMLGFEKKLKNTKRAIQQAIRDIDGISYRNDLDPATKETERQRILEQVGALIATTPRTIEVADSETFVAYVESQDIGHVAEELAGLPGFPEEPDRFQDALLDDQQKFTVSTKVLHVRTTYGENDEITTVVMRTFTYAADLPAGMRIIDIIPKEVAADASIIDLPADASVLKSDPVVEFPTAERIAYSIPKKVDMARVKTIRTVIAQSYEGETGFLTGFAFLGPDEMTGKAALLVLLAVLLYLAYYFDLLKQVKYLAYRVRKNPQAHYVGVLISDAEDQLAANDYPKAELLYKEIRMTYDTLPVPARNEMYDRVVELVQKMDAYYFNLIMIELNKHIKEGDMHAAIDAYEKLSGTFGRLDPERQKQLIASVTAIAKRLGVVA